MIRKQTFGRTGHESTVTIFGAAALGRVTQAEADQTLDVLLECGINHIDTAASYGESELRIGPWMPTHRKHFFLATKTGERTYEKAKKQIHQSLEKMRTDQIDLIQLHNLVHPDDWDVAMGPGGALEAAVEARDQGLVRYIGVTGHGLTVAAMHYRSLTQFDFDTVLLPYNYPLMRDSKYANDFERLISLCEERNVAVQTIKAITRGPWGSMEHTHNTWYQPLSEQEDIDKAVQWVIGRSGVFLNTVGDIHLLPKVFDAADRFTHRPTDDEMTKVMSELRMTPLFA